MSTPEGSLKEFVLADLKVIKQLGQPLWYHATHDDQAGIPDILGCFRAWSFAWELKAIDGRVSAIQHATLDDLHWAGSIAGVLKPISPSLLGFSLKGREEPFKLPYQHLTWFWKLAERYFQTKPSPRL